MGGGYGERDCEGEAVVDEVEEAAFADVSEVLVGLEDVDLLEEDCGDGEDDEEEGLPNALVFLG